MQDPLAALDIKLSGQDFSPVLLPVTQVPLQITGAGIHTNEKTQKPSLKITAATDQPWPSIKAGEQVPAGKSFDTYFGITLPEDIDLSDEAAIKEAKRKIGLRLQKLFMAVFGCSADNCPDLSSETVNSMVGRRVIGKITIEKSDVYGDQNRLESIVGPA